MFQEFNADNHVFFKISSYKIRDKKQMVGKVGIILYIMNVTHQFFFFFYSLCKIQNKVEKCLCYVYNIYQSKFIDGNYNVEENFVFYFSQCYKFSKFRNFAQIYMYQTDVIIKVQQEFRLMLTYYLIYKISQIYCQIFTNAS